MQPAGKKVVPPFAAEAAFEIKKGRTGRSTGKEYVYLTAPDQKFIGAAYKHEDWKKVDGFTRLVARLFGRVTNVKDKNTGEVYVIVNKSCQHLKEKDRTSDNIIKSLNKISGQRFESTKPLSEETDKAKLSSMSQQQQQQISDALDADIMPLPADEVMVPGLGTSGLEKAKVELPAKFDQDTKDIYESLKEGKIPSETIDAKKTFGVLGLIVMDRREKRDTAFNNAIRGIRLLPEEQRRQFLAAVNNPELAKKLDAPIRAEPLQPSSQKFLGPELTIQAHLIAIRKALQGTS